MFTIDPNITELKIREKNVCKSLFSINVHHVATPEMMLEEARSYILFFREPGEKVSAYIALHLLLTDRKLYYVHTSNPFPREKMDAVEEEAIDFSEGLGAVLDEKDFTEMTSEEKDRWIDAQEIFTSKPAPEAPAQPAVQQAAQEPPTPEQQPLPVSQVQQAQQTLIVQAVPEPRPAPAAHSPHIIKAPQPAALDDMPSQPSVQPMSTPLAAAKKRQEIMQKAAADIANKSKQPLDDKSQLVTGVVSRDREALARLLTSF